MKKMKKFLALITCFCLTVLLMPIYANAEGEIVEVSSEDLLIECVKNDNTCKLIGDIVLENLLDIKANVVLDLNGYSITAHEDLTFKGLMIQILHGASLTVNDSGEDGLISSGNDDSLYGAIGVTKKDETDITKTASLIVNGGNIEGYYYAVSGNGNPDRVNTSITINGGTLKGLSEDGGMAVYHPQDGTLTVNGGTLTGATGVEMRAGKLIVNDGTIIGNGQPTTVQPNGSGSTTFGAGVAIAQHTTNIAIDVKINGGLIQGHSALYESDPQGTENDKVTMSVTGGTFEVINGGTNAIYSTDVKNFVSGGKFSSDVDKEYLMATVVAKEENGVYYVGEEHEVTVKTPVNGTLLVDKLNAILGEVITITTTPNTDYVVDTITVTNLSTDEKVVVDAKNGTFVMPDSEVSVEVTFKANANPNTSDNIFIYFIMIVISVVGLASAALKLRKEM